ncbi:MAG: DUF3795 domain-containing protein [Coriobacteriia bacterium]|nr:DUF3795 domain-containing protein [Coriobacteriia bacterium]
MKDTAYAPVCGIYCGACPFLGQQCPGCGNVDGRPFWTAGTPNGVCPLHDCCRNRKQLEHCGLCAGFPCNTFAELRDPNMTDDEFAESLNARTANLMTRSEIGTQAWLRQQTGRQPAGGDLVDQEPRP